MKISIITVSYNSAATIAMTIESVLSQSFPEIEYIIIDGNSTDGTQKVIESYGSKIQRFISEPDEGMYDAINKGIKCATGEIIGVLNSDDFFSSENIVRDIAKVFSDNSIDGVYGDVAFVTSKNLRKVVRDFSSKKFKPSMFKYGYMPAHPTFYVKRSCFEKFGYYKKGYKICADFELVMRFILVKKIKVKYLDLLFVYMQTGGLSNKNLLSRYIISKEMVRACRENGIDTNILLISSKYFTKIFEYIIPFFKQKFK